MKFSTLFEIVSGVHLSQYVAGPYNQRGGLFFVAPSGQLKTTAIETLEELDQTLLISNLTVKSLDAMRETFLSGGIKTLGISDLQTIYRRKNQTSDQIEGIFMSLAEEGYRRPGFSEQRIQATPAQCALVGGMTVKFYESMLEDWLDCGFYRRFLWSRYMIDDPTLLEDAVAKWKKLQLTNNFFYRRPENKFIDMSLTDKEIENIQHSLRFQPDRKTPFVLAVKIVSVMKWKFENASDPTTGKPFDKNKHMQLWDDFAESLSKNGAILRLKDEIVGETKNYAKFTEAVENFEVNKNGHDAGENIEVQLAKLDDQKKETPSPSPPAIALAKPPRRKYKTFDLSNPKHIAEIQQAAIQQGFDPVTLRKVQKQ